jgi:hypothetical protein
MYAWMWMWKEEDLVLKLLVRGRRGSLVRFRSGCVSVLAYQKEEQEQEREEQEKE